MTLFKCPSCALPLVRHATDYHCAAGHNFNSGKSGYVNLLLANEKKSKAPGDNLAMVQARRAFLDAGYFDPFTDHLVQMLAEVLPDETSPHFNLLDVGCGEGYFMARVAQGLSVSQPALPINGYGVDISKTAVDYAARHYKTMQWAVGSVFNVPILSGTMDCLLSIMAPRHAAEFSRILKPDGLVVVVMPAPDHLLSLRERLYPDALRPHTEDLPADMTAQFSVIQQTVHQYEVHLDNATAISNLLKMTPYYWHLDEGLAAEVADWTDLIVPIAFTTVLMRPNPTTEPPIK